MTIVEVVNYVYEQLSKLSNRDTVSRNELRHAIMELAPDLRTDQVERDVIWAAQNRLLQEGSDIGCTRGVFFHAGNKQTRKRATKTLAAARRKMERGVKRWEIARDTAETSKQRERLEKKASFEASKLQSLQIRQAKFAKLDRLLKTAPTAQMRIETKMRVAQLMDDDTEENLPADPPKAMRAPT
jgi:hypothetical protein